MHQTHEPQAGNAIAILLALVAAAAALLFALGVLDFSEDESPDQGTPTEQRRTEAPQPDPETGEVVPVPPRPEPEGGMLLPDGSRVANLNGVTESVKLSWPARFPYSPIIGTTREPNGDIHYVHENGARSTTIYTNINGERKAVAPSWYPAEPVPMHPNLLKDLYAQGALGGVAPPGDRR